MDRTFLLVFATVNRSSGTATERIDGIDWKALSHAVRVGEEAVELLKTGHITFPLPKATHIVDIKLGKLLYQEVADEIEGLLEQVEQAAAASTLPDEPDHQWISDFVEYMHEAEVLGRIPRAYPVSEFNAP